MPVVGSAGTYSQLAVGISLAQALDAHIEAVFVRPDPEEMFVYLGFEPSNRDVAAREVRDRIDAKGKAEADKFRRSFGELCKEAGIPKVRQPTVQRAATARWRTLKGETDDVIPAAAQGADLSVFAASSARYNLLFENVLEITLLRSGRPVLFVPSGCKVENFHRPLIAWNGASSCARAVSALLDMAVGIVGAKVLHIMEQPGDAPDMSQVVDHLGWHGIDAETETIDRGFDSVGEVLLAAVHSADADLVVMGGYGRARYREAVFGGVTRYVMRNASVPVVMAH
jgi:nucleotide-binding universal stress UspA family protein